MCVGPLQWGGEAPSFLAGWHKAIVWDFWTALGDVLAPEAPSPLGLLQQHQLRLRRPTPDSESGH